MDLENKHPDHIVPSYSLTADLLSYLRCRLQYRYHNGSSLPPSRPVQLWFGEFLHGTLELAFRFWQSEHDNYQFPWPCTQRPWNDIEPNWVPNDIGRFANSVENALKQQGKQARSSATRNSGYRRVEAVINQLGPHLFPLIAAAEKKVIGTRPVPTSQMELRCSKYEVHGVIDVLTNMTLGLVDDTNLIRTIVREACPDLQGEYEVIVDYKGSERPRVSNDLWLQGEWQVQTYAWLRGRQPDALPVAAGILIYINELTPGDEEMINLKAGINDGTNDVNPALGTTDEQLVRLWRLGSSTDQLSMAFRTRRSIRVIPVTQISKDAALHTFDNVVRSIEEDIVNESMVGNILNSWFPHCDDEATCVACDFRNFCPRPANSNDQYVPPSPLAP
jgi:hypothetical protein